MKSGYYSIAIVLAIALVATCAHGVSVKDVPSADVLVDTSSGASWDWFGLFPDAAVPRDQAPKCTAAHGLCIDFDKTKCKFGTFGGQDLSSKCPGASNIRCCVMPPTLWARVKQYWTNGKRDGGSSSTPRPTPKTMRGSSPHWITKALQHHPLYQVGKVVHRAWTNRGSRSSNAGGGSNGGGGGGYSNPIQESGNPGANPTWISKCVSRLNQAKCDFLRRVMYDVYANMPERVPPQVVIAQAMLESGWGEHAPHNNILGIKCGSSSNCFSAGTRESLAGNNHIKTTKRFRKFSSIHDCVSHYEQTITSGRYDGAKKYKNDPPRFLTYLWASYYASSYTYVTKGVDLMRSIYDVTGLKSYDQHVDPSLKRSIDILVKAREKYSGWGDLKRERDVQDAKGFRA